MYMESSDGSPLLLVTSSNYNTHITTEFCTDDTVSIDLKFEQSDRAYSIDMQRKYPRARGQRCYYRSLSTAYSGLTLIDSDGGDSQIAHHWLSFHNRHRLSKYTQCCMLLLYLLRRAAFCMLSGGMYQRLVRICNQMDPNRKLPPPVDLAVTFP